MIDSLTGSETIPSV